MTWGLEGMYIRQLVDNLSSHCVRDQCFGGLQHPRTKKPMKKSTQVQSNDYRFTLDFVQIRIGHEVEHDRVDGGKVTDSTAFYPKAFCQRAIQLWKIKMTRRHRKDSLRNSEKLDEMKRWTSYVKMWFVLSGFPSWLWKMLRRSSLPRCIRVHERHRRRRRRGPRTKDHARIDEGTQKSWTSLKQVPGTYSQRSQSTNLSGGVGFANSLPHLCPSCVDSPS